MQNQTEIKQEHSTRFQRALRLAGPAIIAALLLTPIRFMLEWIGLPENLIFIIGLLWLTLGFSIYWGIKLTYDSQAFSVLCIALLLYSPISRIPVFILWWITKTWNLGTHYDIFDNWVQALVGQLFYGSLIQIIPGILLGTITLAISRSRKTYTIKQDSL